MKRITGFSGKKIQSAKMLLAADIGGTTTRLAVVMLAAGKRPRILLKRELPTASYKSIVKEIKSFIMLARSYGYNPKSAALGAAGPADYIRNACRLTKGSHLIDGSAICRKTGLNPVMVMNDFHAVAYSINTLKQKDFAVLNKGRPRQGSQIAVIGAGTGLGACILFYNRKSNAYRPVDLELSHADFPFYFPEESGLSESIKNKGRHAAEFQDVAAGAGIENIYKFLQTNRKAMRPMSLSAKRIAELSQDDSVSKKAMGLFSRYFARAAKNLAITAYSAGGLYIFGGIAQKNISTIKKEFMKEFTRHKRADYRKFLKGIPVRIITCPDAGLLGAANGLSIEKNSE